MEGSEQWGRVTYREIGGAGRDQTMLSVYTIAKGSDIILSKVKLLRDFSQGDNIM